MKEIESYIAYQWALLDTAPEEHKETVRTNLGQALVMLAEGEQDA